MDATALYSVDRCHVKPTDLTTTRALYEYILFLSLPSGKCFIDVDHWIQIMHERGKRFSKSTLWRQIQDLIGFGAITVSKERGKRVFIRPVYRTKMGRTQDRIEAAKPAPIPIKSIESLEKEQTDKPAPTEPPAPTPVAVVVSSASNPMVHKTGEIEANEGLSTARQSQNEGKSHGLSLATELAAVGISRAAAAALAQENAAECRRQLAEFKKRQAAGQAKGVGWLVKAIREGWRHEKAQAKEAYPIPVVERHREAEAGDPLPMDRAALMRGLGGYVRLRGVEV